MNERLWLLRDAITRILADAPLPPATWLSVARRAFVVVACFVIGSAVGDVHAGVLAAFGALQAALIEAALPLRSFIRMLILLIICSLAAVFIGLLVGGSWIAVAALALLAYVFGATAQVSSTAMTVGISSLALGVIFAGMPAGSVTSATQATSFVALGLLAQCAFWLVFWHLERIRYVRRALANKIRTNVRLLRTPGLDVSSLIRTHAQVDVAATSLASAGLPEPEAERMRGLLSATILLTRSLIAWLALREPSEADRIAIGLRMHRQAERLDSLPSSSRPVPTTSSRVPAEVLEACAHLESAVTACLDSGTATPVISSVRAMPTSPPATGSMRQALWPGRISRHGLRMALGVGIAEALTLLLPINHSFWLPLTVVFTLRPDWSFTVIRGLTRTIGNLGAVLVLPALLLAMNGQVPLLAVSLAGLTAITFRNFLGNYTLASFGLAGSVLLLDYTLSPEPDLFIMRILAAILGTLLSIALALALPSWSSSEAPDQVRDLDATIRSWRELLGSTLTGADAEQAYSSAMSKARKCLIALDPTSTGALLEPRRASRSIELAMVLAAGTRNVASLMAVSTVILGSTPEDRDHMAEAEHAAHLKATSAAFDQAVAAYQRA